MQARQLVNSFYYLYFLCKQQSFPGMKDRCTSEPKPLSEKDQKSWDSFGAARKRYCATTALGKPFWYSQKQMPISKSWSEVPASSSEEQRLFSDALVRWGPEREGVSSESVLFTPADNDSVWREPVRLFGSNLVGKQLAGPPGTPGTGAASGKQPSSQHNTRGFFAFFIASMDGTRLTNADSEVYTGT